MQDERVYDCIVIGAGPGRPDRLRYETLYCRLSGDTGNPDFPARSAQRKICCGSFNACRQESRQVFSGEVHRELPGRFQLAVLRC